MAKTAKTKQSVTLRSVMAFTQYANGTNREFFHISVSANKTRISVYILGIKDRRYLAKKYGNKLGKASVTGYCIKFKTLKDINVDILERGNPIWV